MVSNCATSPPVPDVETSVANAWCNTRIKSNTINYTWTINNFSLRPEKMGKSLTSSKFSDGINEHMKWKLRIYPKGETEESKEFVSIYLQLSSLNKSEIAVKYEISILTNTGEDFDLYENTECNFKLGSAWGSKKFIEQDTLMDPSNNLLPDDILTISCKITFLSDSTNISGLLNSGQIMVPQSKLFHDFGNLFDEGELSDLTIIVGNHEISAHKAILAARSSYFSAMFKHETQESLLSSIAVTDVEHDVLKEMLNFIYTDKAPNLDKMAAKLLPAADKYDLERLKLMCEESLRSTLSIGNAIETLTFADRPSAVQLKSYATEFIKSHISEIIATGGWQNLITTQIQQMLPSMEPTKLDKEDKSTAIRAARKHSPYNFRPSRSK